MDIVELASALIEFESVSYREMPLMRYIAKLLSINGIPYIFDQFNPGEFLSNSYQYADTANIYVDIGHGNNALLLYAHADIVNGKPGQFKPILEDEWLIGRGATDMKSSLAGLIATIITNYQRISLSNKRIIFAFVADEETSGTGAQRNVKWLQNQNLEHLWVVLTEPSENFREIDVGGKGYIFFDIEGHVSSTIALFKDILRNRTTLLAKYLSTNPQFGKPYVTLTTLNCAAEGVVNPEIVVNGRATHASRPEKGENALEKLLLMLKPSVNFINTGENSPNTIPDYCIAGTITSSIDSHCKATIDVRTTPEADANDALLSDLKDLFTHHSDCSYRIRDRGRAYLTESQELLELCLQSVKPRPKPTISMGGSDAGYYAQLTPHIIGGFGPGERVYMHTDHEKVSLTALQTTESAFTKIVDGFLTGFRYYEQFSEWS